MIFFLILFLFIINSIHLENSDLPDSGQSTLEDSTYPCAERYPEATGGDEPWDKWLSNTREGLLTQVGLWLRSAMYLLQAGHG